MIAAVVASSKEDDVVFQAPNKFFFAGKAGEDVGKELIVVFLARIGESSRIENE